MFAWLSLLQGSQSDPVSAAVCVCVCARTRVCVCMYSISACVCMFVFHLTRSCEEDQTYPCLLQSFLSGQAKDKIRGAHTLHGCPSTPLHSAL